MENKLIKKDISELQKSDIDLYVNDIINNIPEGEELEYYQLAYKFEYLAKLLKSSNLKDKALKMFIHNFHGETNRLYNGFKHSIRNNKEWQYTDKVKEMETKIKVMQEKLKSEKRIEETTGTAKVISESSSLTLTLQ